MKVEITNNEVVIRLPLTKPILSSTGKTFSIASTHGWQTTETVHEGKRVKLNVNVAIPTNG